MVVLFIKEIPYKAEVLAAIKNGFTCLSYSHEKMVKKGVQASLKDLPVFDAQQNAMLRGGVVPPDLYKAIFTFLAERKNIKLVNSPDQYLETCSIVNHYAKVQKFAAKTVWTDNIKNAHLIAKSAFGDGKKLMLKDYMRSVKYQRKEAYDISDSGSVINVNNALQSFIEAKKGNIEGGFVFSEYIPFKKLAPYPLPGTNQPLYEEFRLWFFRKKLLLKTGYFEELKIYDRKLKKEELTPFLELAKSIESDFFVMDLARKKDNSLNVLELNPGQTSGINYYYHYQFYKALSDACFVSQ